MEYHPTECNIPAGIYAIVDAGRDIPLVSLPAYVIIGPVVTTSFDGGCVVSQEIVFRPIGYVENDVAEMMSPEEIASRQSRIILAEYLADGLMGIDALERIVVVFYFDRVDEVWLQLHPRGDTSRPMRGVFATRTMYRPNPIGVTVAQLIRVDGNVLTVRGLDAIDGTPVLDIKPYSPTFDGNDAEIAS